MQTLSIVIVNWNSGNQLRECIESVRAIRMDNFILSKVIVVDNNSIDDSMGRLYSNIPLEVIHNNKNVGFGAACNQGAIHCTGDYILFLNPDARLYPDSLAGVFGFMQKPENAKVGICGVQLVDEDGNIARSCARFPSASGFVAHAIGLDRIIPTFGHFMSEWDHATTRQVDHVIGAFFLLRRSVFDAVRGFDETFFVYLEDIDISYRAKQLGWSSVYFADAQAFHAGGGTSRQIKAKRLFYSLRSRILYAFKHFHPLGATVVLLATLFIEPLSRSVLAVSRRSWASLKETWAAYGMLFRWLSDWILKGATR
ncbi:MAG: glycosyltransferase family 2 protein [Burkholderiaceae bacterium]